jgi:lipid A ethanolaminephosphotransferase
MSRYQVYFSKEMIRNIIQTDFLEARELFSITLLPLLLVCVLLAWAVFKLHIRRCPWKQCLLWRAGAIATALTMVGLSLWPVLKEMLPLLREHKELRYLVTPANYIVSTIRVINKDYFGDKRNRPLAILDPNPVQSDHATQRKPIAVVLVLGEAVRAQNWGLNGYARQTTPRLAAKEVINFSNFASAGTDTATSLPAMFSVYGRADYNQDKIEHTESLLHLLNRAGVSTLWRDNQSGDKGVDSGLPFQNMGEIGNAQFANGSRYFDEILLTGLNEKIDAMKGDALIVLHMLGNHGPAYFERYPDAFRKWTPVCDSTDLAQAGKDAVINSYDNAILYTDYVIAKTIDQIAEIESHDTAVIYVSDHGESLGENGIFLHGLPYWMAPEEQTHVPMCMWFSKGLAQSQHINLNLLRLRAAEPASHDYLFHTLLKLLDVKTTAYNPNRDLL